MVSRGAVERTIDANTVRDDLGCLALTEECVQLLVKLVDDRAPWIRHWFADHGCAP